MAAHGVEVSPARGRTLQALRERLLRRGEYWKAEAQAVCRAKADESPAQRAARRQRVLRPLLRNAGIVSDEQWAAKSHPTMDRNTPRDYRLGKTKGLRLSNRKLLAAALGVDVAELPE